MTVARERASSAAVRMLVGVTAFSWVAFLLLPLVRNISPDPYRPAYVIGGAVFGMTVTVVTRDAGRRALGRLLAALGYVALCMIVAVLLLHPGSDTYIEFLPDVVVATEKFVAITLLPIPLWCFLASRAGRPARRWRRRAGGPL